METKQLTISIPLIFASIALVVASCGPNNNDAQSNSRQAAKTDSSSKVPPVANNYEDTLYTEFNHFPYLHHIRNEGPKPVPGQKIYYQCNAIIEGERTINTIGTPIQLHLIIPSYEEIKNNPSALTEVMLQMTEGDSATVSTKGSSVRKDQIFVVILERISNG